jgi:hypothetical protein
MQAAKNGQDNQFSEEEIRNIKAYLLPKLLKKAGFGGAGFESSVPSSGTRTRVIRIVIKNGPIFYLKLFNNIEKFTRILYAHRFFERHGLSVPRLMIWSYTGRLNQKVKGYFLLEEGVPGNLFIDVKEKNEGIAKVAKALAKVHNVTRSQWGPLLMPRFGNYFSYYFKRTRRRIADLVNYEPTFSEEDATELHQYYFRWRKVVGIRDYFELIHGRVNTGNFIINSEATIIDLVTAAFGHFAYDLIRALHRFCEGNAELEQVFLNSYFSISNRNQFADYDRICSFYHIDYHLAQASSMARHRKRNRRHPAEEEPQRSTTREHLSEMLTLLEGDT